MFNKKIKIPFIIFLFIFTSFTIISCQKEKEVDYRADSNFNQAIDVTNYYLKILKEDFDYGISVTEEIAQAWDDAIAIYGRNWARALDSIYLPTLFNRNKFTFKPYYLSGDQIMELINTESPYLPEQIKTYNELYILYLHVKDMVKDPSGSLVSYQKDIKDTKTKFTDLYRKLEMEMPKVKKIEVEELTEKEKQKLKLKRKVSPSTNFWGITKGTTHEKAIEILNSKNIKFEDIDNVIKLEDVKYYDVDWSEIEITFSNNAVQYMEFDLDELVLKSDIYVSSNMEYHDIIKTPFLNNFYYVNSNIKDGYAAVDTFTSLYRDKYGNCIEIRRDGFSRIDTIKIFVY